MIVGRLALAAVGAVVLAAGLALVVYLLYAIAALVV